MKKNEMVQKIKQNQIQRVSKNMKIFKFDLNFAWISNLYFEAELQGICIVF